MTDSRNQLHQLHESLRQQGWSVTKIMERKGEYVVKAKGPGKMTAERTAPTAVMALANLLGHATRANRIRQRAVVPKTASWSNDWQAHSHDIAEAYRDAPVYDPKAASAFKALGAEMLKQAAHIRQTIRVETTKEQNPYSSLADLREDVKDHQHLYVSTATTQHGIWSPDEIVALRTVHDVLGVVQGNQDYSWAGVNAFVAQHMPLLSLSAREALMTEMIGRAAYEKHYRGASPSKVALMSDHLSPVAELEGEHIHVPHGGTAEPYQEPDQFRLASKASQHAKLRKHLHLSANRFALFAASNTLISKKKLRTFLQDEGKPKAYVKTALKHFETYRAALLLGGIGVLKHL